MASPADIAREYLEAFNRRDWAKVHAIVHSDYTYTGGDGQEQAGGPEVALGIMEMYASAFPDVRLQIRRQYTQGETSITEFTYDGTHSGDFMGIVPTGKRVRGPVIMITDVRDGKIYREREVVDLAHMLTQMGVSQIPAAATAG